MFTFLINNAGTILIGLVLILIVGLVIRGMIRDKKAGKSSCGGNCGACGGCAAACHTDIGAKGHGR